MKTIMRPAEPKDVPQLIELHQKQLERDGTKYPLPEIFSEDGRQDKRIPLAMVVSLGSKIFGAVIFEDNGVGVEMMLIGCSPRITAVLERERNAVLYTLRLMGFQWIRSLIPKRVVNGLKKPMKGCGFRRDDNRFASFFREV